MPDAPQADTKARDLERARHLLARALSTDSEPEAISSFLQTRKLLQRHGVGQAEILGATGPRAASQQGPMPGDDPVTAAMRNMSRDPDVQRFVGSLADLFRSATAIGAKRR